LERGSSMESSARNHLSGKVLAITSTESKMAVRIDCGFLLTAHITQHSAVAMHLKAGSPITVVIKAASVHLIQRGAK